MGSYLLKSAPTPTSRQVICETSDQQHFAVDLDVLRLAGTFDRIYRDLGVQENEAFPGVFPMENVDSRVFEKVIQWWTARKDQPFILEKDPVTQECVWFQVTEYDRRFFDVPVEEQLELVMAALYLDVPSLEHHACQAIAERIKGKQPADVRGILRQRDDLSSRECADILHRNPWLDSKAIAHRTNADISDTLHISSEVLVTTFEKLTRADLERLQLVSAQFRDVILSVNKLGAEQGPLRLLRRVEIGSRSSGGHRIHLHEGTHILCRDHAELVARLNFCSVETLLFYGQRIDEALHELLPAKMAWKNAKVCATLDAFSSERTFTFAFSELFLCKSIRLVGFVLGGVVPSAFLRLPAMVQCNELDIGDLLRQWDRHLELSIEVHDIVEWLEREDRKKWDEPSRLYVDELTLPGDPHELIEALKKVFLAASSPHPYVVEILLSEAANADEPYLENKTTHEELHLRKDEEEDCCLLVERK